MSTLDYNQFIQHLADYLYEDDEARSAFRSLPRTAALADHIEFDSLSMFRVVVALELMSDAFVVVEEIDIPETTQDLYDLYLHLALPSET